MTANWLRAKVLMLNRGGLKRALVLAVSLICLCAFSLNAPFAQAHSLTAEARQTSLIENGLKFERLTIQQGLPSSRVYSVLQDRTGFIWFGTDDGLARYDGYSFVVFRSDPEDENSLSDNTILTMYEDRLGRIWIGTQRGGLNRYDRSSGQFTRYLANPEDASSLSDNLVLAVQEDGLGQIWVGTQNGLNRYIEERASFVRYPKDNDFGLGTSDLRINALAADSQQGLWIGTAGGLDYLDLSSEVFQHYRYDRNNSSSLGNNQVTALWREPGGGLWVGTARGLDRLDPRFGRFAHYRYDPIRESSLSDNSVLSISVDQNGVVWIGTRQGGVNRFFPDEGRFVQSTNHPDDPYSLSNNMVFSILEDQSGVVWVATDNGVSKYDPMTLQFPHYRHIPNDPASLSSDNVMAIYEGRNQTLWIGTDEGLDRLDRGATQFIHYRHDEYNPASLAPGAVTSIIQDSRGALWLGTDGNGLDRLDISNGQFTHFFEGASSKLGPDTDKILALYIDHADELWVGTNGAGVKRLDQETGQFTHYGLVEQDANFVTCIFQDRSGGFWIGTHAGLGRLNQQTDQFELVNLEGDGSSRLRSYKVFGITENQDSLLWLGTLGGGLILFDPVLQQPLEYLGREQLANTVIYGVLEIGDGLLWLSTNKGLIRFDPDLGEIEKFNVSDGLQSDEFNPGAAFRGVDGHLYFGGVHGFNVFDPAGILRNSYVPPVVLTSLSLNAVPVQPGGGLELLQEIILRWPGNYFEFEYAALSFRQSDENQYSYRLEGFDEQWNEVGARRYGQYTNLPGGTYTLRIRGSNNDGVWNNEGVSLKVTVIPPWWEMAWFRWGVPLVLILSVVGAYILRLRGVQRRNRQLALEVEERTREIEQRRQVAEGLREVLVRLNSSQPLEETLEFIAAQVNRLTGSYRTVLFAVPEDGTRAAAPHLLVYAENVIGGFPGLKSEISDEQVRPLLKWLVGELKADAPLVFRDIATLPRQRKPPQNVLLRNVHAMLLLPVLAADRLYGGMAVMFPARRIVPEDISALTSLADQAALAVENEDLRLKAEQLAVVSERARLARDLHDAVSQTLFSASLVAEALPAIWQKDEKEGLQLLAELRQLNRGALAEMRSMLMELRPSAVVEVRLSDLLYQLAESLTGRTGIEISLDLHESGRLPEDVHVCFYRIAQETISNIIKHAQASQVKIGLTYSIPEEAQEKACVCLEICDNGRGFDFNNIPADHFGVRNMRERAEAIGAELQISSQPGEGTQVRLIWKGLVKLVFEGGS